MTTPPYFFAELLLGPLRVQASPVPRRKFPHPDDAKRHQRRREFRTWSQSPSRTRDVDRSADRSLTIIRSAVVTHPPFAVSREQMRLNGFRSVFPEPRVG